MKGDRWILLATGVLWVGAVGYGMKVLSDYRSTAGPSAPLSTAWPAASALRRAEDRDTLVMLAHPQCPCTRASLSELNVIMNRLGGRVAAYVLFVRPEGFAAGWERTDSWARAEKIPGVTVVTDVDEREAVRFHAYTSGQTFLYDRAGRLLYSGGITSGRGHEGDNEGRRRVMAAVDTGASQAPGPVFGCVLFSPGGSKDSSGG